MESAGPRRARSRSRERREGRRAGDDERRGPIEREEIDELTACADCGDEIAPATDEAFAFGETGYLCLECGLRRGGCYDADQDRWTVAPDVSDLWDERRPHP